MRIHGKFFSDNPGFISSNTYNLEIFQNHNRVLLQSQT